MQHSSVRKLFQEQIERYSGAGQATDSLIMGHFLTWARKKKTKKPLKICEFGGGAGQLLAKIGESYPQTRLTNVEIVGDYQKYLVSPKIKFVKGSILDSLFPDKSFDVLIIRDVLHHLVGRSYKETGDNQRQALGELKRLVRPGGVIFIDEYTHGTEMASWIVYFFSKLNSKLGINFPSLQISSRAIVAFLTSKRLKQLCDDIFGERKMIKEFYYQIEAELASKLLHLGTKLRRMIIVIEEP